jgi:Anti-sigma factor NepR
MSGSDADDGATLPRPEMREPRCGGRTRAAAPRLGPDAQDRIGRDLRRMYEALLLEPLPERILDLISRLGSAPRRSIP